MENILKSFAHEKGVAPGWISFCNSVVDMAQCRDRSFSLLASMELILTPNCSSLSNDLNSFKTVFLKKKKRVIYSYK